MIFIHDKDCGAFVTMSVLLCRMCNALRSFLVGLSCLCFGGLWETTLDFSDLVKSWLDKSTIKLSLPFSPFLEALPCV